MKTHVFLILSLCALAVPPSPSAAVTDGLSGRVVDAETDEPIVGCILKAGGSFTSADNDGRFTLTPEAGADSVSFRFMG